MKPVAIFGLSKVTQGRLFVMGRVLMYACFVTFIGSYLSYEWVCSTRRDIVFVFCYSFSSLVKMIAVPLVIE